MPRMKKEYYNQVKLQNQIINTCQIAFLIISTSISIKHLNKIVYQA